MDNMNLQGSSNPFSLIYDADQILMILFKKKVTLVNNNNNNYYYYHYPSQGKEL